MSNLITLFSNNLLPILLTAAVGFFAGKLLDINSKTVSRLTFNVFSPSLVFTLLTTSQLSGNVILQMVGFAITTALVSGLLAILVSKLAKFDRKTTIAIIITVMFTNAGNFGLSLTKFAFGEEALAYASVFFVTSATMIYTIGVTIASTGKHSIKDTALSLFKLPPIYAVIFAALINITGFQLPDFATRSLDILGDAAIPMMLILLGIQLRKVDLKNDFKQLGIATIIRLAVSPVIALVFANIFGLTGAARQAGVVEASMPTAVMTIVLATEYDLNPSLVTSIVTVTTILSPLSLTPLISLLGA